MAIINKMHIKLFLFPLIGLLFYCASPARQDGGEYIDLDAGQTAFMVKERLKEQIKKFYGSPYKWGGSTPKGTDCSGMVKTIYKNAANIELPHNADMMYRQLEKISPRDLRMGDLVFFSSNDGIRITHVGIYIQDGYFVHASSSRGVILSKLNDRYYKKLFVGAARVL